MLTFRGFIRNNGMVVFSLPFYRISNLKKEAVPRRNRFNYFVLRVADESMPTRPAQCAAYGAGNRGRTGTVSLPPDFESGTSANSIIPAHNKVILTYNE